jgi:SecD/SecF fusion protein
MRRPGRWVAFSGVLVALSVLGLGVRGLDLGVEFTGGRMIQYSASAPLDVERARQAVSDAGFPRAVVQAAEDGGVAVRTQELDNAEQANVTEALSRLAPGHTTERDELIGPSLGSEQRNKALIALGVALLAQLAYLSLRFRWTYGASAALAMAHDVVILIGVFAWLGKPVDGVFLAALLTVIGYSVNDTVVLFDRVRERRGAAGRAESWSATVNSSVLSTAPRTVNTGLGALFVLVALAVLGGDSLHDFAVALLIGIVAGTWSSSFTAAPLLIMLQNRAVDGGHGGVPAGGRGPEPARRRTGAPDAVRRPSPERSPSPSPERSPSHAPHVDPADPYGGFDPADPYGGPDGRPDSSGARL